MPIKRSWPISTRVLIIVCCVHSLSAAMFRLRIFHINSIRYSTKFLILVLMPKWFFRFPEVYTPFAVPLFVFKLSLFQLPNHLFKMIWDSLFIYWILLVSVSFIKEIGAFKPYKHFNEKIYNNPTARVFGTASGTKYAFRNYNESAKPARQRCLGLCARITQRNDYRYQWKI